MTRPAKLLLPILFVCLLLGGSAAMLLRLAASLGSAPTESIPTAAGAAAHAVLTPTLLDAATGEPICGGVVCIPEASLRAETAANGKTAPLRVPVLPDSRYSEVQSAPWGELLLLTYAEGYVPIAYLYRGPALGADAAHRICAQVSAAHAALPPPGVSRIHLRISPAQYTIELSLQETTS